MVNAAGRNANFLLNTGPMPRLKKLEAENAKLKRMYAALALDARSRCERVNARTLLLINRSASPDSMSRPS
jgi:hypothetical protein